MELDFNFLDISLDNCKYILQRKRIYDKDIKYISVVFNLCRKFRSLQLESEESLKLYAKMLDIQKIICNKYFTL